MLVTDAVATALTELGGAAARRDHTLRGHPRTLAQVSALGLPATGQLTRAPMTSGWQSRLKH